MNELSTQEKNMWASHRIVAERVLGADLCGQISARFTEVVDQPLHRDYGYTGVARWLEQTEESAYDIQVQVTIYHKDTSPGNTTLLNLERRVGATIAREQVAYYEKTCALLDLHGELALFIEEIRKRSELNYLETRAVNVHEKLTKALLGQRLSTERR